MRDAILRSILTDPDDDLPRLAMADLLEESGQDVHAEFIRLQLQLARTPDDIKVKMRAIEILFHPRNASLFVGPFAGAMRVSHARRPRLPSGEDIGLKMVAWEMYFRGGFIERIHTSEERFLADGFAKALFSAHPVREVKLWNKSCDYFSSSDRPHASYSLTSYTGEGGDVGGIDPRIFKLLTGGELEAVVQRRHYRHQDYVAADSSRACVKFGRLAAGLPPFSPDVKLVFVEKAFAAESSARGTSPGAAFGL